MSKEEILQLRRLLWKLRASRRITTSPASETMIKEIKEVEETVQMILHEMEPEETKVDGRTAAMERRRI